MAHCRTLDGRCVDRGRLNVNIVSRILVRVISSHELDETGTVVPHGPPRVPVVTLDVRIAPQGLARRLLPTTVRSSRAHEADRGVVEVPVIFGPGAQLPGFVVTTDEVGQ